MSGRNRKLRTDTLYRKCLRKVVDSCWERESITKAETGAILRLYGQDVSSSWWVKQALQRKHFTEAGKESAFRLNKEDKQVMRMAVESKKLAGHDEIVHQAKQILNAQSVLIPFCEALAGSYRDWFQVNSDVARGVCGLLGVEERHWGRVAITDLLSELSRRSPACFRQRSVKGGGVEFLVTLSRSEASAEVVRDNNTNLPAMEPGKEQKNMQIEVQMDMEMQRNPKNRVRGEKMMRLLGALIPTFGTKVMVIGKLGKVLVKYDRDWKEVKAYTQYFKTLRGAGLVLKCTDSGIVTDTDVRGYCCFNTAHPQVIELFKKYGVKIEPIMIDSPKAAESSSTPLTLSGGEINEMDPDKGPQDDKDSENCEEKVVTKTLTLTESTVVEAEAAIAAFEAKMLIKQQRRQTLDVERTELQKALEELKAKISTIDAESTRLAEMVHFDEQHLIMLNHELSNAIHRAEAETKLREEAKGRIDKMSVADLQALMDLMAERHNS